MKVRITTGRGISGAVRYVLGPGRDPETGHFLPKDSPSRVDWIGGTGFGFPIATEADADLARKMMEFGALYQGSKTKRCEQVCVHMTLSWERGETPSREQMEKTARSALAAQGMANAKALFVAHHDEDYAHLHCIILKINPATNRAYDMQASYRKASLWAEQYERDNGGVVNLRRQTANELRAAIAKRDEAAVLEALTKQRPTFTEKDLNRALQKEMYAPIGATDEQKRSVELERAQFARAILSHPNVLQLTDAADGPVTRYTTRAVYRAELHVIRATNELAENTSHGLDDRQRGAILANKNFASISEEQKLAFRHATGPEGLAIIDGQAGTGKSYTISAICEAYEAAGHRVIGLGPTNRVAKAMGSDGFDVAKTIHSELFALNNSRTSWHPAPVVIVDEAAMIDTKLMAMITAHANDAGAKLILVGDDRQLSSIDRGGMFAVLKHRHGAAELADVKRQHKVNHRRASEMMAEGNFDGALGIYEREGSITWSRTQPEARAALVKQWAKDSAENPGKSRLVFAITNEDVDNLNLQLRAIRKERGELKGEDHQFDTPHGRFAFSANDRIRFTGTDKQLGVDNGDTGTITVIDGTHLAVRLDRAQPRTIDFDEAAFNKFRHAYAGTIYSSQGATIDECYLYHTEHWRSSPTYVVLTRHKENTRLFVARNTAKDLAELGRQVSRTDDRRAATHFYARERFVPVRPLTAAEILAEFGGEMFRPRDPASNGRSPYEASRQQQKTAPKKTANEDTVADEPVTAPANDRQKPFSEPSIYRDPWSAVYRPIPADADRTLLELAHIAAGKCRDAISPEHDLPGPQQFAPTDLGKDASDEDNLRRATERLAELETQLRNSLQSDRSKSDVPLPPRRERRGFLALATAFFAGAEKVVSAIFHGAAEIISPTAAPDWQEDRRRAQSADQAQKAAEAAERARVRAEHDAAVKAYGQSMAAGEEQHNERAQKHKHAQHTDKDENKQTPEQSARNEPTADQESEIHRTQRRRRSR